MATSELLRVAKAQAPLFVSVFNLYGIFRTILGWHPEELTDPFHEELFTTGIHRAHYQSLEDAPRSASETDVYYFHPDELKELLESEGVQTLTMATCQGLSSQMYEATNSLYRDAEKWKRWTEILLRTCEDPSILGLGNQLVYVGRKEVKQDKKRSL